MVIYIFRLFFFFFNDTATTEIYTLSLHDALPISMQPEGVQGANTGWRPFIASRPRSEEHTSELSHPSISYAVFCLKKKKKKKDHVVSRFRKKTPAQDRTQHEKK